MPLVWQQNKCRAECSWAFPWPLGITQRAVITKDVSDGTKNTTNLLLSCNNYCRPRKKQFKKEKADEMVGLINARSPEVYKLLTENKRSDTSPISAESWTEHLQSYLCNHKRALLTCYLDDPTYLHGISYSVTSYNLDKFLLRFHPALVAGTGAWTLPFNAAVSKHLYTSYLPYILWLPLSRKIF